MLRQNNLSVAPAVDLSSVSVRHCPSVVSTSHLGADGASHASPESALDGPEPDTMKPDFYADLEARGLVHQATSDELLRLLRAESVITYIGFDPTADSLHVGSLLPVLALMRLQRAGHKPIAVVGGGTGMIGDPSGKSAERNLLTPEQIDANLAGQKRQLERLL